MAQADGSVVIEILGDAKDINSKLAGIAGGALKKLTAAIAAAGTALSGVAVAGLKIGTDFEKSMSQVAATMGLSVEEIQNGSAAFEALEQAAKDAGATTAFTASQSAEALNYLALAGYDAQTSIDVLPAVLNLAAAGNMDLAYASDLATDAMAALGIEASKANLEQFGDKMARTASKSNTSVAQLGEAILTVGGTAKSLAGGTTELNAALGVLANRGIKGAEGGTALRNIIIALGAPIGKAAKTLENLGVSAYDAEGKMRPLNEVFSDLNTSMEGMSEAEKTNALNEIFNRVDLKSAQALLAGTGEEFDSLAAAISDSSGAMEQMADVQLDNLTGDITILKSGIEGLAISIYDTLQVNARGAVQSITGAVQDISEALTNGGIPAAIDVAGKQIARLAVAIVEQAPSIIEAGGMLIQSFLTGLFNTFPQLVQAGVDLILQLTSSLTSPGSLDSMIDASLQIILALAEGISNALPKLTEQATIIIANLAVAIIKNLPKILLAGMTLIEVFCQGISQSLGAFLTVAVDIITAIVDGLAKFASPIVEAGKDIIRGLWQGISDMAGWIKEKIQGFGQGVLDSLKDFFGIASPSRLMRDEVGKMLGEGVAEGIEDSTKTAVKSANAMSKDVSEALSGNALDGVDITALSNRLKAAVEAESANLSARLTVSSNAPAEARAARDRGYAAQAAAANYAYNGKNEGTFVLNIDGKEFYRGTLDSLRTVEDERPRTLDDT